ncbi:TetR/AcrR family transcriptional regulator [Rhodococcus spelaei]|uniref:TetR/AcrR family transcriptional regulator n=1 Tax=Rhodococcus spelaei TaxID=2546320 RepID=A0A541BAR6_9NOCA|nr:TetR/AcrR family transcriptional regulator [Rhodococcus spelaei]TQF69435.1 TetR/AcrR family transcriptional regulator [Rhodococcus spelaei]
MSRTPGGPVPPRRGRPPTVGLTEQRREQILSAAMDMFAVRGYDGTTAAQLAAHAGMGMGTLYRYFGSKREILDQVVDRCVGEMLEALERRSVLRPPDSPAGLVDRIRDLSEVLFGMVASAPRTLRLLLVEANSIEDERGRRLMRGERELAAIVARLLDHGIADGWLRRDLDTSALSHAIIALTWPGLLRGVSSGHRAVDADRYTDAVVGLVTFGLRAPSRVPEPAR